MGSQSKKDLFTGYTNANGNPIPRVTSILNLINTPEIIEWSNYLGWKRKSYQKELNLKAIFGTKIHLIIYCILSGRSILHTNNPLIPRDDVYHTIDNFIGWGMVHTLHPIYLEKTLISDEYGGTCDYYGLMDGKYTILDFKTSKQPRPKMFMQLGAYCKILESMSHQVDQVCILIVNPSRCQEYIITRSELDRYIQAFEHLLSLFYVYHKLPL